jgi:hypothetical protein
MKHSYKNVHDPRLSFRFDSLYIGGDAFRFVSEPVCRVVKPRTVPIEFFRVPNHPRANPGTLRFDKLTGFKSAGINRLNIGVQSFRDAHLNFLGRIHTAGTRIPHKGCPESGFDNLGLT